MLTCPYCEGELEFRQVRFGWRVAICRNCGSMACLDDVPADLLRALYADPAYYKGGGAPYGYEDIDLHDEAMIPIWEEQLGMLRRVSGGKRLLELGPGSGRFIRFARDRCWDTTAVDPYPIAEISGRVVSNLSEAAPYAPFDAVCLFDVLEHFSDPAAALREIGCLLASNGCVCISLPSMDGPSFRREGLEWREVKPPEHLTLPSARGMRELFARVGFQPVRVMGHFMTPREWTLARRTIQRLHSSHRPMATAVALPLRVGARIVEVTLRLIVPAPHDRQDYVSWFARNVS